MISKTGIKLVVDQDKHTAKAETGGEVDVTVIRRNTLRHRTSRSIRCLSVAECYETKVDE